MTEFCICVCFTDLHTNQNICIEIWRQQRHQTDWTLTFVGTANCCWPLLPLNNGWQLTLITFVLVNFQDCTRTNKKAKTTLNTLLWITFFFFPMWWKIHLVETAQHQILVFKLVMWHISAAVFLMVSVATTVAPGMMPFLLTEKFTVIIIT